MTSLLDQVEKIKNDYMDFNQYNEGIVSANTKRWIGLGRQLNDHKKNVIANGINWRLWVTEHILFIKVRRRQQIMIVAELSDETVTPLLTMGIDRLYTFIMKLITYSSDPEIKDILKVFNFQLKQHIDNDDSIDEQNASADKVCEYFKYKKECVSVQQDRELVIAIIASGAKFEKKDYENINSQIKIKGTADEYLKAMLYNGSSPSSSTSSKVEIESLHSL